MDLWKHGASEGERPWHSSSTSFGRILMPILSSLGIDVGRPEIHQVKNIVSG
jgi:hypothetical protein